MNVYIKTSSYIVKKIMTYKPREIEFRLSKRLEKQLIKPPLLRYNQIDYICSRHHIDNLVLQVNKPRIVMVLPVYDYFVRCSVDPRLVHFGTPKIVFRIDL